MAVLMKGRASPGTKRRGGGIVNYYVIDNRRRYRVCCQHGRVLMVMLRHVHCEQPISMDGRRFREVVRNCAKNNDLILARKGTTFHLTSAQ